jgi:hypothetical protein
MRVFKEKKMRETKYSYVARMQYVVDEMQTRQEEIPDEKEPLGKPRRNRKLLLRWIFRK